MLETRKLLGYEFVNSNMSDLVREVHSRLVSSQRTFIVTANPEIINNAVSDISYEEVIKKADYVIPDGIGVILASRIYRTPLQERLPGFDLMENLLKLANRKAFSVYLLGTEPHIIGKTAARIQKKYPNINIVGFHHGYFTNDESIKNEIIFKKPDLVFVGLGCPKQEKWIAENIERFEKGIFIGVGGSLNVWAGVVKRAPKFWQTLNLEWFYRLLKEPSRWKRMMGIPLFLKRVLNKEFK